MADTKLSALTTIPAVDRAADLLYIVDDSAGTSNKVTPNTLLGISGDPVGTSDTQTLTNKTLTSPTVSNPTFSGTLSGTYTIGGTPTFPAAVVTLTGTQTLTNKTLTSPTINTATIANPTLTVDTISEFTSGNGVTIDGLNIKDGTITTPGVIPTLQAIQIYTSSTTWNKPVNMGSNGFVIVEVCGAGGGGGGAASSPASNSSAGGPGGAGGFSRKRILAASLGSSETVTVGTAGTAGSAGNNNGGNGGNSSFGSHCSANGGNGGSGMQAESGNRVAAGGTGGTATGGDINITGQNGAVARVHDGWPFPAAGGDTPLGMGGVWQSGGGGNGAAGRGYGAGGGGGVSFADSTARAGGAGAGGIVIVYEYY